MIRPKRQRTGLNQVGILIDVTVLWIIADASLNRLRESRFEALRDRKMLALGERSPRAERSSGERWDPEKSIIAQHRERRRPRFCVTRREVRAMLEPRCPQSPDKGEKRVKNNAAIYHGLTRVSRNAEIPRLFSRGERYSGR